MKQVKCAPLLLLFCLIGHSAPADAKTAGAGGMVLIPAGSYTPFFPDSGLKGQNPDDVEPKKPVQVAAFLMDVYPVTKAHFLKFLKENPRWRKSRIQRVFTDSHYLQSWKKDLSPPASQSTDSPVTEVSWFAAQAYCRAQGKSLPTVDQWEYVSADQGRGSEAAKARILAWYAQPNSKRIAPVGSTPENGLGVSDLHGLIWEWTLDFNSAMVSDEAREGGTQDSNLFCGNGSTGARDSSDYASFMRYSFRASLKAAYSTANLGFRCVKGLEGFK